MKKNQTKPVLGPPSSTEQIITATSLGDLTFVVLSETGLYHLEHQRLTKVSGGEIVHSQAFVKIEEELFAVDSHGLIKITAEPEIHISFGSFTGQPSLQGFYAKRALAYNHKILSVVDGFGLLQIGTDAEISQFDTSISAILGASVLGIFAI